MSTYDTIHQHGPGGGEHVCIFCQGVYACTVVHSVLDFGNNTIRQGGRCCPECRMANIRSMDRWGWRRG